MDTHGPPLQAFISAGFSPTQSPPPPPSLTPPRVRHTTSLFCTPGPHCAEHWGPERRISLGPDPEHGWKPLTGVFHTHGFGPAGEVPVGHARPHVALLAPLRPSSGAALHVVHHAALVGDAVHAPRPPSDPAVHRALKHGESSHSPLPDSLLHSNKLRPGCYFYD